MKSTNVTPLRIPVLLLGVLLLLTAFLATGALSARAAGVIHVPGDFTTIQAAVDAAGPGDIIQVAGTYNEQVLIDGKSHIKLRGKNALLQGSEVGIGINIVDSHHIQILGFTVDGFHTGIVLKNTDHSRIHNVETSNNGNPNHTRSEAVANHDGLQLIGSNRNLITNVFAHDNGHNGISLKGGSMDNTLRGNTANDNGKHPSMVAKPAGCGIQISRGGTTGNNNNTIIANETLRNAFGILVSGEKDDFPGSTGNSIVQNRSHENVRSGIDVRNGSSGNFIGQNNAKGNGGGGSPNIDLHDEGSIDNTWKNNQGNSNF